MFWLVEGLALIGVGACWYINYTIVANPIKCEAFEYMSGIFGLFFALLSIYYGLGGP